MGSSIVHRPVPGLERSCEPAPADRIRTAPPSAGLERVEAAFSGHAFDRHRHDSYAIGVTLAGVQSFTYRGAAAHSLPGQLFVLHPDEAHDGHAGTGEGFRYRIAYVDPALIQEALGTARPLPFVRDPVSSDPVLGGAIRSALGDLDLPLDDLGRDQIILGLADALVAAEGPVRSMGVSSRHWRAVARARAFLDAHVAGGVDGAVASAELEAVTGLSRWDAARHFRACLGTSPHRYLVLRRLDKARALIRAGFPLVQAAVTAGFADQSHMTRHFRKAYGMPPGRWAALV